VVQTGDGGIVEVQCTAEGRPISRDELNRLIDLASGGIQQLLAAQRAVLAGAGVHVL
jgi:ribonuclease PH